MPPYRVQLEYRPGIAPATVHEADAELMFIVQGAGAIVTGGKLADEKRTNPTNLAGSSIVGGQSRGIKPGDVVMIPNSVAHQVIPASGQEVVIFSVHMPNPLQSGWIWP
jgi:mannose-6-phosphate isomerase-like protein (cupin superfamily)